MTEESKVTTTRRELAAQGELAWGGDGRPWRDAINTNSDVTVTDQGCLEPASRIAIPDSVIHHWTMDDGSGTTFVDSVGGADASFDGTWESDGVYGDYAYFGGSDEATTDSAISLDVAGADVFTIGAAIKPDFDSSRSAISTITRWFPDSQNNFVLWWDDTQEWQWGWSNTNLYFSPSFTQNDWFTISMTVASDGSAEGFFDGAQQFTDSWGSAVGSAVLPIGHDDGSRHWVGGLRNLFIADEVLTQTEIQSILQP